LGVCPTPNHLAIAIFRSGDGGVFFILNELRGNSVRGDIFLTFFAGTTHRALTGSPIRQLVRSAPGNPDERVKVGIWT